MKKLLALILAIFMVVCLLTACSVSVEKKTNPENVGETQPPEVAEGDDAGEEEEKEEEPSDFYNKVTDNSRPIAVMIDNDADYTGPQAGIENAFMVYEVYVEGGNTRMMALFKESFFDNATPANTKIGPVRSARHYFLDFALENGAIYAHCGWSPKAQAEISSRGVENINGLYESAPFFRDSSYNNTWHNLYTDFARLDTAADSHGYARETSVTYDYNKNYSVPSEGATAKKVSIPYSQCNISYTFNEETGLYDRVRRGSAHKMQSGKTISAMNILVLEMENVSLNDGENKGRQELYNSGSGKGKYITGGKVIDITWEKSSRAAKAKYRANGEDISLNPGLTFVQIVPPSLGVTIN